VTSKIIVNLYADDTTVYLSKNDKYSTLENILLTWCAASGAKFNLEKTEIIPIGPKPHRERVCRTRCPHPNNSPLTERIRIAEDGHPTRILGTWIGNDTNPTQVWSAKIQQIQQSLRSWATTKPTLDAHRLIVQMIVDDITQFLTKAQGMPPDIEMSLQRIVRNFIWDDKRPPPGLGIKTLHKPKSQGGIDLLNIEARNNAIDITWLEHYLNTTHQCPTWGFVIDAIINSIQKNGIQSPKDINTFLTTLRPTGRTKKNSKQTPHFVIRLLRTAKRWNLSFAPRKLSKSLKRQLPAWFHIGVLPHLYHKQKTKCLRATHNIEYI
jgi:hypothetical protein